jgi:hypothetical protein
MASAVFVAAGTQTNAPFAQLDVPPHFDGSTRTYAFRLIASILAVFIAANKLLAEVDRLLRIV